VVVQTATFEDMATEEQPVIETPFTVKLMVPVAPAVTVAVSVTDSP
jgi:hypothetical protein